METTPLDGGIDPGVGGSFPENLTDVNGTLYFSADNASDQDDEPYTSNGLAATRIQNINTTTNIGSNPSGFTALGGHVYFAATSTNDGRELWRATSLTSAEQVTDVVGSGSASPTEIASANGRVLFSASDDHVPNRELWTAGGPLTSGAAQALDLFPGVFRGGNPTDIVEIAGVVYFVGEDELSGREIFVLNEYTPAAQVTMNDGSDSRSQITSVTVAFDAVVDVEPADFVLTNIDTSTVVTNVQVDISEQDFRTVAVLTFGTSGASVQNRIGTGVLGNSLADGNYRLDVLAANVNDPTSGPGLAADLVFGGQTKNQGPINDNFYRLYGDVDGDGDTDFTDFSNDFLPGFGTVAGNAAFRPSLDFDGDGDQDFTDFVNGFLPHFGTLRL
jgi:ELWxxDGT repeat protein